MLKKIQLELQNYTGTIMKIMKSLQLETVDIKLIRDLLERTPIDKREMLLKVVDNLNKLMKMRQELFEKEKLLQKKISYTMAKAKIWVESEAYLGSKVRFGDSQITLAEDLGNVLFELKDDKII
jgi:uncharacterized protein (DUF342 family)